MDKRKYFIVLIVLKIATMLHLKNKKKLGAGGPHL
jgi:hypothetical protein